MQPGMCGKLGWVVQLIFKSALLSAWWDLYLDCWDRDTSTTGSRRHLHTASPHACLPEETSTYVRSNSGIEQRQEL